MHQPEDPSSRKRSALDWPQRAGVTGEVLAELAVLSRRRTRRRWTAVSAVAVLAVVFVAGVYPPAPSKPVVVKTVTATTVVSAPAQQILPDGTRVDLREDATFEVDFKPAVRRIVLRRGMAHFQVMKDAARPFVVEAQGVTVRAVGTAFSVQLAPQGVEVLVTEGRVALAATEALPDLATPHTNTTAGAGDRVTVDAASLAAGQPVFAVMSVPSAELAERQGWLIPRLKFSGTRLDEAVAMFNHHNRRQLVLADDSLAALQISGVLRADNLPALFDLLRANFGIEAETLDGDQVRLRRAP